MFLLVILIFNNCAQDNDFPVLEGPYLGQKPPEMISDVIKGHPRDSYVIVTKIYEYRDRRTDLFSRDAPSKSFIQKLETSLKRMGLNYVDILYLHNISRKESILFEPYFNVMKKLKQEGKVRFLGISTHRNEPEIITATTDSKEYDVILTSYNFRQHHHQEIKKAIDYAAKAGIGIIGMKAIAGSAYNIGKKVNVNAKATLKWALQSESIHTNVAGFTTFDQMYTDLSIMKDLKLISEDKAQIKQNKAQSGLYCQQCEKCIPLCRENLNIPILMRSYMYAYGYKNMSAAHETIQTVELYIDKICINCIKCTVTCSMNFDIKAKIMDIARIKNVPEDFLV